jgi:4-amino-4-deoxy-L-arabinose transferase-like glycosyltransferase
LSILARSGLFVAVNFVRRHAFIIGLVAIVGVIRFAILFLSQRHVVSDEAIVGLMAKHILQGRNFPFYLYGVSYSGSGAWEAYLAVIPFALCGAGVFALKSVTVLLSLVSVALFYAMAKKLYDERVASIAAVIFALWPALLKWHFQAKGYAFYFISIPVLVLLFARLESKPTLRNAFLFGLACGVSIWSLEIITPIVAALWVVLLFRGRFRELTMSIFAAFIGYAPVIYWNFTHHFANWRFVLFEKPETAGLISRFAPSQWWEIFVHEMPKFFGPDTAYWYFPETPWTGCVMYVIAGAAVAAAIVRVARNKNSTDLLMLVLIAASFALYLIAPLRVPGYFLAAAFFMSILVARLIVSANRILGAAIFLAVFVCGDETIIRTAGQDQIETLVVVKPPLGLEMARIPGRDIDAVERDLAQNQIRSVWTTISFVYPLIFESNEQLVASESIFGIERSFYPPQIPKLEPSALEPATFVLETNSPYRHEIEETLSKKGGAAPRVAEYGTLTVIQQQLASQQ